MHIFWPYEIYSVTLQKNYTYENHKKNFNIVGCSDTD